MKAKEKYMLLKTVQDNNILPVTSRCNMNCLFCSHHYNPPGIEIYRYGSLDLELVNELIEYLPPEGPVILGESATKIVEGEPFTHPRINSILSAIRSKWPQKTIKITTNGSLLTEETVKFLKYTGNIKLNISLNCSNPEERSFLMKDNIPDTVFKAFTYLDKYNISYEGSIVALPHIMGWDSIKNTISLMADYQTKTVRIFLPGFTSLTPEKYRFSPDLYSELKSFIAGLNSNFELPLILEPPLLKDFSSRIIGIIPGTPAAKAGLKKDDIVTKINGYRPQTRVETFNILNNCSSADLMIKRNNRIFPCTLKKEENTKSGIILNYDLNPKTVEKIQKVIKATEAKNIIIVTSEYGQYLIKRIINRINNNVFVKNISCIVARNNFFGGSIMSAGLLVNSDIIKSIRQTSSTVKPELIILPGIIYDLSGNDLTGSSYHNIEEIFSADLEIIN